MSSDDSFSDSENPNVPRLNMKHGFIHHIRNNQYWRDNYDKKMKEKQPTPSRKPKQFNGQKELYVPPNLQKSPNTTNRKILFKVEYTTEAEKIVNILVHEGENPNLIARKLQQDANIPQDLIETLAWKIEHEQNEIK